MFIKRCTKTVKGKTYVNHVLVQSVSTPKGPRHKTICSLGNLEPGSPEKWLELVRNVEKALTGQLLIEDDPVVASIVEKVKAAEVGKRSVKWAEVDIESVETEEAREAGSVHAGHQMWLHLGVDDVLQKAGLNVNACALTEVLTLNRLVKPKSEHATSPWAKRTALPDILGDRMPVLNDTALYRNLDKLHPSRNAIEKRLYERERALFGLDSTVYLYDLTSTYFEGQCAKNEKAKHGYSRDKRGDCKQVVIGLVVDGDCLAVGHEVFEGNRADTTTVEDMLKKLDERTGMNQEGLQQKLPGLGRPLVVVDRGMAAKENLEAIKRHGYSYMVACRASELDQFANEFASEEGWNEVIRQPSSKNPYQHKTQVRIKRGLGKDGEIYVLCRSDGRLEKDRAIRRRAESALEADLSKLQKRVGSGRVKKLDKIHQAVGRLRERHSRVARFYEISVDENAIALSWRKDDEIDQPDCLDGAYVLKTDRQDLADEDIWRTYMLLTRVEAAFNDLKSPIQLQPVYHQLARRVETHIFICILAYHLLVAIEKKLSQSSIHESWETIRAELSTHQVVTTSMLLRSGDTLKIRKGTTPEERHKEIYRALNISDQVMTPQKLLVPPTV